jgi:hypothetical protein
MGNEEILAFFIPSSTLFELPLFRLSMCFTLASRDRIVRPPVLRSTGLLNPGGFSYDRM